MMFTVVAVSLGILFVWGVLAPRHQWNSLIAWTRDNPRDTEPGPMAYRLVRLLSLVGIVALTFGPVTTLIGGVSFREPPATASLTSLEKVWGQPRPVLLDRVFTAARTPSKALVQQEITGYQLIDNVHRVPNYLFSAKALRDTGMAALPGFLGVVPRAGSTALATASFIVHVRGDDRCIPQQVGVVEAVDSVRVGVFFGHPTTAGSAASPRGPACDPAPSVTRSRAFLIPVDLAAPLNDRAIQSLSAKPISTVPLPG